MLTGVESTPVSVASLPPLTEVFQRYPFTKQGGVEFTFLENDATIGLRLLIRPSNI